MKPNIQFVIFDQCSTKDAAKKLGLSPDHVKRLARDEKIEAIKVGRDWIILNLDYERKRSPKRRQNDEVIKKLGA